MLHIDNIAHMIRSKADNRPKIVGVPDAGFFLDYPALSSNRNDEKEKEKDPHRYSPIYRKVFHMQNASKTVNQGCLDHFEHTDGGSNCFFAQYTLPFIQTPIFVVNSLADAWQQTSIMHLDCQLQSGRCGQREVHYVNLFADEMRKEVKFHLGYGNGAWLNMCSRHTQLNHGDTFTGVKVNGLTMRDAFYNWYNVPHKQSVHMDGNWGSNKDC